jgi:hypothetical protein
MPLGDSRGESVEIVTSRLNRQTSGDERTRRAFLIPEDSLLEVMALPAIAYHRIEKPAL